MNGPFVRKVIDEKRFDIPPVVKVKIIIEAEPNGVESDLKLCGAAEWVTREVEAVDSALFDHDMVPHECKDHEHPANVVVPRIARCLKNGPENNVCHAIRARGRREIAQIF